MGDAALAALGPGAAGPGPAGGAGRVAEVRASDFVGPGAVSALGGRIVRRIRQGMSVPVLGSASRLHT